MLARLSHHFEYTLLVEEVGHRVDQIDRRLLQLKWLRQSIRHQRQSEAMLHSPRYRLPEAASSSCRRSSSCIPAKSSCTPPRAPGLLGPLDATLQESTRPTLGGETSGVSHVNRLVSALPKPAMASAFDGAGISPQRDSPDRFRVCDYSGCPANRCNRVGLRREASEPPLKMRPRR
jgi:hypothetical protein